MSDVTREHLDTFWMLVDEILNAVLFVLVGFELIAIPLSATSAAVGVASIVAVLFARLVTVGLPVRAVARGRQKIPGQIAILTWGGLRGGISVALALSLPENSARPIVVSSTYLVVVFSVLVQGLSLGRVARRYAGSRSSEGESAAHES